MIVGHDLSSQGLLFLTHITYVRWQNSNELECNGWNRERMRYIMSSMLWIKVKWSTGDIQIISDSRRNIFIAHGQLALSVLEAPYANSEWIGTSTFHLVCMHSEFWVKSEDNNRSQMCIFHYSIIFHSYAPFRCWFCIENEYFHVELELCNDTVEHLCDNCRKLNQIKIKLATSLLSRIISVHRTNCLRWNLCTHKRFLCVIKSLPTNACSNLV